jgi:methylenetetrahydrofolate dehydrogenase (NADP+)/methenyltetrahydrofolate cyclohydrolase
MIIDGKLIARELKTALKPRVQLLPHRVTLGVLVAHETPLIRQFVELKRRFGEDIGVDVEEILLTAFEQKSEDLLQHLLHATRKYNGLILQLPLPPQFHLESVLGIFPLTHDVDVIGNTAFQQHKEGRLPFLPPVIGAMAEILHRQGITLAGRKVLVVGEGRLVGAPAVSWAQHVGGLVSLVTKKTGGTLADLAPDADVIILGAGSPGLLTPDMVKEGAIILDAGTSESQGVVRGDADPACAAKAMIFTPTPGGIGPITVAKIFENLLTLVDLKEKQQQRE